MEENETNQEDSILTSIKKMLGISSDNTDFDTDIIIHINTVFGILNELGVGPSSGYMITDANNTWADYGISDDNNLNAVKSYMYLKVKMLFDPPITSAIQNANTQLINELEWRLNIHSENKEV
jgi:hypothetical protein